MNQILRILHAAGNYNYTAQVKYCTVVTMYNLLVTSPIDIHYENQIIRCNYGIHNIYGAHSQLYRQVNNTVGTLKHTVTTVTSMKLEQEYIRGRERECRTAQ